MSSEELNVTDIKHEAMAMQAKRLRGQHSNSKVVRLCIEIEQLRAKRDRLAEIVERLPKTADGVPITPGMTAWWYTKDECGGGVISSTQIINMSTNLERFGVSFQSGGGENPKYLYSTREAALAAKESEARNG